MSSDLEMKVRSALERGKPLIEAVIADLEREATLIKERDLDPRKLADEPRVQEARSAAVDALEHLTEFAKLLDKLVKSYAADIDKRVDVDSIKEHLVAAPAAGKSLLDNANGHAVASRIRTSGDEAKDRVELAAHKSKEQVEAAAHKGKDSTAEMLAALGWASTWSSWMRSVASRPRKSQRPPVRVSWWPSTAPARSASLI
jgi:hypothetical protein